MGAAALQYDKDAGVAWDEMWTGYCELALAGGAPHRGSLLEPVHEDAIAANPERYEVALQELERGIKLVTGLPVLRSETPGWIGMQCHSEEMALWLLRAIVVENITVRRGGAILWFPAGPGLSAGARDQECGHGDCQDQPLLGRTCGRDTGGYTIGVGACDRGRNVMLPTHQYITTHNGYEIYQRKPGFEFTPITLGEIASYIVRGEGGSVAVAAFMYSMLIALEGKSIDEDKILAHAVATIRGYIDAGRTGNHEELTFAYNHGTFVEVSSPRWWVNSFE